MLTKSLCENGYTIIDFKNLDKLYAIQEIVNENFPCVPTQLHNQVINDDERLQLVKKTKDKIAQSQLIKNLLLSNADTLTGLLGPDVDIQSDIYLRVSRPNLESDFIDWHRDTFYGNSFWELNFWLPIFPLQQGAGLMLINSSHLTPAKNIREVKDSNSFRNTVSKGSIANELGYLYAPKSDDTIAKLDPEKLLLLKPELGQAVLFFTHMAHRAHNESDQTRITIDLRIKNMFAPTNTKPGYFQPLTRSIMTQCVEQMIAMNQTEEEFAE